MIVFTGENADEVTRAGTFRRMDEVEGELLCSLVPAVQPGIGGEAFDHASDVSPLDNRSFNIFIRLNESQPCRGYAAESPPGREQSQIA